MMDKLFGQFGGMMNMLKGGANPQMMMNMMTQGNPKMVEAFKWAQEQCKQNGGNIEQYVRQEFQKSGMDVDSIRKQFGI